MVGKRVTSFKIAQKGDNYLRKDIEDRGKPLHDRKYRFRDHGYLEPDDQRRVEFKKKLLAGVDRGNLEGYRKSDDEVCFPSEIASLPAKS